MIISLNKIIIFTFILVIVSGLTSCRKEEQGRPLKYNKGIYEGNPDTSLTNDNLQKLRLRASSQGWY